MGNSLGDITFYSLKIEEVDCTTGKVMASIYTTPPPLPTVTGASQLTALALNDLVINGSDGYFIDKCCRCYRVEATIGNPCGQSTDFTYIKIGLGCNCLIGGGGVEERNNSGQSGSATGIYLAPNPVNEFIQFYPDQTGVFPAVQNLTIFGAAGSVVFRLKQPDLSGPIVVDRLPVGIYTYILETEAGPISGKFVKI